MNAPPRLPVLVSTCAALLGLSFQSSTAATSLIRCDLAASDKSTTPSPAPAPIGADHGGLNLDHNAQSAGAYFVSPWGNDDWSGRRPDVAADHDDGPFATIERARDAIRADRAQQPAIKFAAIYLRGGRYELKQPLVLTAQDAGIAISAFHNEQPEISGSRSVQAALDRGSGRFEAVLPADPGRDLFIGGVRQALAFKPSADADGWRPANKQRVTDSLVLQPEDIEAGDVIPGSAIELIDESRSRNRFTQVVSLDTANNLAKVGPGAQEPFSGLSSYRLVGNPRWISSKGQFGWNNAAHLLVLNPTDVAALRDSGLRLPKLQVLIILRGAHDNAITGLRFAETGTASPDVLERAAVMLERTQAIRLSGNEFLNVGQAIRLIGSTQNIIEDNIIRETGAHGIELQDDSNANLISANKLTGIGRLEINAAAIYLHGASSNRIARNIIHDTSRHAIGIDNWDDHTINRANIVEFNQVWQTNQDTDDTGAIEMLGRSRVKTASIIRFNEIGMDGRLPRLSGDRSSKYRAISSIYLDDLTSGVLVCGNRIRGAPLASIHIHGGSEIEVRDNLAIIDQPGANFIFLQGGDPSSGGQRFDFPMNPPVAARGSSGGRLAPSKQPASGVSTRPATHRIEVRFDNDATVGGEDRDLFISKIKIGAQELRPTDPRARYMPDNMPSLPGQVTLPWNGALVWELPDNVFMPSNLPFSVFAWGNPAGGVGAHFVVTIDGARVGDGVAVPPADEMRDNRITHNIVYITGDGGEYFKSLRGGAPLVSANDYFDTTGKVRPPTSPVRDTAPLTIDPGFIDPAKGDFRLRPSSALRAAGFADLPVLPSNGS
jgi:parallel beta-helix repeat protein